EKVAAIPGVTAVGLTNSITMDGNTDNDPIFAADKSYADGQVPAMRRHKFISPGFFKAMGNPLLAGRDFTWTDIYETRRVVLVSEALARELWRDPAAALGKQVRENPKAPWREVVGVVGNERDDGADHKATAIVYWPMMLRDFWGQPLIVQRGQAFAIRSTRTGSASLLNEVRRAVWSVNPDLPIAGVRTMQEVYDRSMARTAFTLVMLSIAAGMALLLGIVGIYGVISYAVSQRTREIGIRIALGAPPQSVRQMFVREGLLMTAIGVVCGLAAAAGLTRLMKALLFEVSPLDPATYCAVSLVLAAAALLASYIPPRPPGPHHGAGGSPARRVGQASRLVRSLVGQALGLRRPLTPPGLAFNNLRCVFDRARVFRTRFAASAVRSGVHCNTRRFSMRIPAAVLLAALCPALFAQSPLALPGCEARPEVRQVIDGKLANKALENMKFTDRLALKHQVLDDLIAKYPRELEPYRQLIQATRFDDPEAYAALSERYVKQAEQHPDDPLAQYLAALVLTGKDTPRSVQLLEQARSKAPGF